MNSARALSVLVVDDERSVVLVFERLFGKLGYRVVSAATGLAGLERLRQETFDVFLIDKNLPDVSGLVVAKAARERALQAVILLVTGYPSVDATGDLVGVVDACVSKPFELEQVRDTVAALLALRRVGPGTPETQG